MGHGTAPSVGMFCAPHLCPSMCLTLLCVQAGAVRLARNASSAVLRGLRRSVGQYVDTDDSSIATETEHSASVTLQEASEKAKHEGEFPPEMSFLSVCSAWTKHRTCPAERDVNTMYAEAALQVCHQSQ